MTVASSVSRTVVYGNSSATTFAYPFKILSSGDLSVIRTTSAGVDTTLALGSDYSVSGVGSESGGWITYPLSGDPLPTGDRLTLRRVLSLVQETDLTNQGAFYAEVHESQFDVSVMIDQQLQEQINRALTAAPSDTGGLVLPNAETRAGRYLVFDGNGNASVGALAEVSGSLMAMERTGNGAQTAWLLPVTVSGGSRSLVVAVDGVVQPVSSYTVAGSTLTFGEAPPAGAAIDVRVIGETIAVSLADASQVTATGSTAPRTLADRFADVVNVEDFGAAGDGTTDDAAAIQAAINHASLSGGAVRFPAGTYCISAGLVVKCAADLPTTLTGSDLHFTQTNPVSLVSDAGAVLKATAAMSKMVEYIFDTTDGDVAPFFSSVIGLHFDGNALATDCLYMNYTMHMHVERCRMRNFTGCGIRNFGYGVAQYIYNVIKGPRCIFIERGGDSLVAHNDLFPTTGGIAAIDCGYWSGNTTIDSNVITREEATGNLYGIRLSGDYAASGSVEVRHVVIQNNEFCGLTAGVYGQAYSTGARNVYQCVVSRNHVTPFGATNIGCLAELYSCEGFVIDGNFVNKSGFGVGTATHGLRLNNCIGMLVQNNVFQSLSQQAINLADCLRCRISGNHFYDIGTTGASYIVIGITATSQYNVLTNNYLYQSSASYAQNGIYEAAGDFNRAENNTFVNIATPYFRTGTGTIVHREEFGTAKPAAGRYHAGDRVINTAPAVAGAASSQYIVKEWVRITDGTSHVLNTDWVEARTLTGT